MVEINRLTPNRIIGGIKRRIFDRLYPVNAFRGVYQSFDEAQKDAPRTKPIGYDLAQSQNWYQKKLSEVWLEDYPVVFWLGQALADSRSVFEVGGHIGEAFYAFQRLLSYPPNLVWSILDVPTIAESGTALARERRAANLSFVTSVDQVAGADIVFAAGALQYLERGLADMISGFTLKPRHILINVTPIYDGPDFVTLQNIGRVYCPYRVFNRRELVGSLERLGYELRDSWGKPREFRIKGHPDRTFHQYSGLYLRAAPGRGR